MGVARGAPTRSGDYGAAPVPTVSVVIPARDAAATLGRALADVAAQEVDHELIVVDDGSSDATAGIAHEHGGRVLAERARLRFFPALARRIPELREDLFFARAFLNRRSAAFDLALAGALGAAASRRRALLAAAAPYAALAVADGRRWGKRALPRALAANLAADAVGAGALAYGSARARSLLL
jgi:glycosyltransferase involved in cell wall biosynthesis